MTKKHLIELADVMRECRPDTSFCANKKAQWRKDVCALADFCARVNPRFDRARWYDYIDGQCGPSGGAVKNPPEDVVRVEE